MKTRLAIAFVVIGVVFGLSVFDSEPPGQGITCCQTLSGNCEVVEYPLSCGPNTVEVECPCNKPPS